MAERQDKKTEASASTVPMKRAEDLLRKMTIEEKAMQLQNTFKLSWWLKLEQDGEYMIVNRGFNGATDIVRRMGL